MIQMQMKRLFVNEECQMLICTSKLGEAFDRDARGREDVSKGCSNGNSCSTGGEGMGRVQQPDTVEWIKAAEGFGGI
jgi:hypothetical protein